MKQCRVCGESSDSVPFGYRESGRMRTICNDCQRYIHWCRRQGIEPTKEGKYNQKWNFGKKDCIKCGSEFIPNTSELTCLDCKPERTERTRKDGEIRLSEAVTEFASMLMREDGQKKCIKCGKYRRLGSYGKHMRTCGVCVAIDRVNGSVWGSINERRKQRKAELDVIWKRQSKARDRKADKLYFRSMNMYYEKYGHLNFRSWRGVVDEYRQLVHAHKIITRLLKHAEEVYKSRSMLYMEGEIRLSILTELMDITYGYIFDNINKRFFYHFKDKITTERIDIHRKAIYNKIKALPLRKHRKDKLQEQRKLNRKISGSESFFQALALTSAV